jgi:hypothetical protein
MRARAAFATLATLVAVLAILVGLPAMAMAAGGERMVSFTAAYVLDAEGGVSVTETIVYQFPEGEQRRGILRAIIVRQGIQDSTTATPGAADPADPASDPGSAASGRYRYYAMSDVSATSPSGAPAGIAKIDELGAQDVIYVGDPNQRTSGTQTYVLKYHLANVLNQCPQRLQRPCRVLLQRVLGERRHTQGQGHPLGDGARRRQRGALLRR